MTNVLIFVINIIARILTLLVVVEVLLSYVMSPYDPVRSIISKIIEPILNPIRRLLPPIHNIDFSPLVLVILIQVVEYLMISIISAI